MSNDDVVILSAARTPLGRLNGQLVSFTAVELGAHAIAAAIERAGIGAGAVDAVIMGQVLQAGAGQNPARQSAIAAGVGWDVPCVTINKVCLSGLTAVIDGTQVKVVAWYDNEWGYSNRLVDLAQLVLVPEPVAA